MRIHRKYFHQIAELNVPCILAGDNGDDEDNEEEEEQYKHDEKEEEEDEVEETVWTAPEPLYRWP